MKKQIALWALAGLVLTFSAQAQTTSSPTLEELQKQIQLLLSQIESLQKEVVALKSTASAVPIEEPATAPFLPGAAVIDEGELVLNRSLARGSRGEDVRQLQEFLAQDIAVYPEGLVTGYYGPSTEAAVRRWQAQNGVPSVGVVGRQTIAKLKEVFSSFRVYAPPSPTATSPVLPPELYTPIETQPLLCPALSTVDSCPAGEERIVTYKSEQCGVYYACQPRETAATDNTIAVLKKVSSIQTDNRYVLNLYDPEGVQRFVVYNSQGAQVYSNFPACRKDWSSPTFSAAGDGFPLKLQLSDCTGRQFSSTLETPVVVKKVSEGLIFPYTFSNGKNVYSSGEARFYCYANGPASGQGIAAECETKFGVVYTRITPTAGRAAYLADSFSACMTRQGFGADAKLIKTWAQSPEPMPWSVLTNAAQNAVNVCEKEYYGQGTVETGAAMCSDGKDNDGDGFIDAADSSCSSDFTVTPPSGQKEQVWNSLGLKSWIRTDADPARIAQLKQTCAAVGSNANIWLANAGNYSSADFGLPDSVKCQKAQSCTSDQYFDGSSCRSGGTPITGLYENSYGLCSDKVDNDKDGLIDTADPDCASFVSTPASGQKEQVWNSLGLKSWIRTDADATRINQLKSACASVPSGANIWTPNAGLSTSVDFGMPDAAKCSRAAACTASQYFDGASCVTGTGTTWPTTTGSCDSALSALLGTGCHYMYNDSVGNQIYCDGPMTKSAKRGDTAATAGCSSSTTTAWPTTQATCASQGYSWCTSSSSSGWCQSGSCPAGDYPYRAGDANSCPSFAYSSWDNQNRRYCRLNSEQKCDYDYPSYLTSSNYTAANCPATTSDTTTTSTGSCSQYGDGWHIMGDNNCYNSSMTEYRTANGTLYSCSSTPSSGCSSSSSACTSGQYWNGTACVTSTTSSSSCSTPSNCYDSAVCASSGWYWYNGGCWSSPQSSTTSSTGSTACTSGQYWDGTACVTSTTTACPSGQYWSGSSCVATSPSDTTPTTCPSGQYWSGSACVSSTSPSASIYEQMGNQLRSMEIILRGLLGRE